MADNKTGKKGFFSKLISAISGAPMEEGNSADSQGGQYAPKSKQPLDERFVHEFTHNGGNFLYCGTQEELIENLKNIVSEQELMAIGSPDSNLFSMLKSHHVPKLFNDLKECDAVCTYAEALIAFNGGIMVTEHQTKGQRLEKLPSYHIAIGKTSQLVENLHEAMSRVNHHYRNNRPSQITMLKGPKDEQVQLASADPNKNRHLFLLLIEDSF